MLSLVFLQKTDSYNNQKGGGVSVVKLPYNILGNKQLHHLVS